MQRPLLAIIARTRRRIRLQRALNAASTGAILSVLVATVLVYLLKAELIGQGILARGLLAAGALPVLAAAVAWLRPVATAAVAKRIDTAHDLCDRIGNAVEFSTDGRGDDFKRAHIAETLRHVPRLSAARAVPLQWPHGIRPLGLLVLCLAFVLAVRFPTKLAPAVAPPALPKLSVAAEELEPHRALAAQLHEEALEQGQEELARMAEELNRLFEQIQREELTRKELFAKLAALENKFMEGLAGDFSDLLKKLAKMGGELKKEKLTKDAGDALEQADLARAKQELEKLAQKLEEADRREQKQLARSLRRAARQDMAAQKKDAQRQLDQLNRQIRRLQRQLQQKPQDKQLQRRLQRKRRQLQRLNQQRQQKSAQRRQLQRLNRELQNAAEQLANKLSPEALEALQKAAEQMGRFANQINKQRMLGKARTQVIDLKELLRRLGKGGPGRKGKLEDFYTRAKGKPGGEGQGKGQGKGKDQGKGKGKGGTAMLLEPGGQGGQLLVPMPGSGASGGQAQASGMPGDGIGASSDPNVKGDKTDLKSRRRDVRVRGAESDGPVRSEVILGAADKGFATRHYRRVYSDYTQIVEEVIQREDIPLGYKYYVKRYFQLIKPR